MQNKNINNQDNTDAAAADKSNSAMLQSLDKISDEMGINTPQMQTSKSGEEINQIFISEPKKALTQDDLKNTVHAHLKFYLTGHKQAHPDTVEKPQLVPALSTTFQDMDTIRYDYPLIAYHNAQIPYEPLASYSDRIVKKSEHGLSGQELLRKGLLNIELELKKQAQSNGILPAREAWKTAFSKLFTTEKERELHQEVKEMGESLPKDALILPFVKEGVLELFKAARFTQWRKATAPFFKELEDLIQQLTDIIEASTHASQETFSVDALQNSLGQSDQNEVDLDSLSSLVTESFSAKSLPKKRFERIKELIDLLTKWRDIVSSDRNTVKYLNRLVATSTKDAMARYHEQKEDFISFFKSIRMARLEIEHRYEEDVHDPFFAGFSSLYLSEEDWEYFPPILLHFKASKIQNSDKADLVDILASIMPIKVVLTVDDLYNSSAVFDESFYSPGWSAVLGKMALSLNTAYVLQFPLAYAASVASSIESGTHFNGPALFSILDGFDGKLDPYIRSAAGSDSRAFPVFCYNPDQGNNWADHFSITNSTQHTQSWPTDTIYVKNGDENEEINIEFTLAEYLTGLERYKNHYWAVSRSYWHDDMVPLSTYINPKSNIDESKIPYILMVDSKGELYRVIVTKTMCTLCTNAQVRWNRIQELSGINNSHLNRKLAEETKRIEAEFEAKLNIVRNEHSEQMDRAISHLSDDIISNIAQGLLQADFDTTQVATAPAAAAASVQPAASEPAAEVAAEKVIEQPEEEEDELSFDDPYIDTPLCTSCNDCRNINERLFLYDENKQAYIEDAKAGTFADLVNAAEKCPVNIIHPGKPLDESEENLEDLMKRAEKFNK